MNTWPAEQLIGRGYGIAALQVGDLAPDDKVRFSDGVIRLFEGPGAGARPADAWGALAAWAWGASRAMDYFQTDGRIDPKRIAVVGHSRGGKAAPWAGAVDERFAMVVSNESGEGGAALSRRNYGETLARITETFPHWFAGRYTQFAGREAALPGDQHMLLAWWAAGSMWPVPTKICGRTRGRFLSLAHASPVFAIGVIPIAADAMPRRASRSSRGAAGYQSPRNTTSRHMTGSASPTSRLAMDHQQRGRRRARTAVLDGRRTEIEMIRTSPPRPSSFTKTIPAPEARRRPSAPPNILRDSGRRSRYGDLSVTASQVPDGRRSTVPARHQGSRTTTAQYRLRAVARRLSQEMQRDMADRGKVRHAEFGVRADKDALSARSCVRPIRPAVIGKWGLGSPERRPAGRRVSIRPRRPIQRHAPGSSGYLTERRARRHGPNADSQDSLQGWPRRSSSAMIGRLLRLLN